jgi:pilus assembly protein Flp/PilA
MLFRFHLSSAWQKLPETLQLLPSAYRNDARNPHSMRVSANRLKTFPCHSPRQVPRKTTSGEDEMIGLLKRFANDETGATAIEYGLIAAGISVAIISVVQGLGTKLNSTFGTVKNALK